MFDGAIRHLIDGPLDRLGRAIAASGITASQVTLSSFLIGLVAAACAASGAFLAALLFLFLGRLGDGLDGAVARASRQTDRGGFLDIVLDFFFYGAFPAAFAVHDPAANAMPAVILLLSFYMNGAAFLAFAVMAAKRGIETTAQGQKSLYYITGLAEGFETIAVFAAFCLLPGWFPVIAYGFAVVCVASALARVLIGWRALGEG